MRKIIPRLSFISSDLMKNSAKMLSGNIIAQVIGILFYPLLTRLYSAQDFGLLNLFVSFVGILTLLSTADYQYAIVLPRSDKKAMAAVHLGGIISIGVFLVTLLSVPFSPLIAKAFKAPGLERIYILIPFFGFLSGIWTLLNFWFTRKKQFGNISRFQVSQVLWNSCLKYIFGLIGFLRWGLFSATILGLGVSLGISLRKAWKEWKDDFLGIDWYQIRKAAARYARFPLFSLPRNVMNNLSGNLPFFLLTPAFGLTETGYLGMAFTLALRPIQMVIASIYQTFFQHISEKVIHHEPIKGFLVKFIKRTLMIVVPGFAALYFILPWLCEFILGTGWGKTGEYIQLMLPYLAGLTLASSLGFIPDVFQKQGGMLVLEIIYLILRVSGLMIGITRNDMQLAVLLYCMSGVLVFGAQLLWFRQIINNYSRKNLAARK